jgi:predicted nucleic acid-binding protein
MKPAIVVDASAMSEVLIETLGKAEAVRTVLERFTAWIAPHHLDLECASTWRGMVRRRELSAADMADALADLADHPVDRLPTVAFHARIAELDANVTPYDAAYVVLAEAHGVPLLTADARLTRAPGPRCEFILV